MAARASAPTWSTPGRPCRKRRSEASDAVTSSAGMPSSIGWIPARETWRSVGGGWSRGRHGGAVRAERRTGRGGLGALVVLAMIVGWVLDPGEVAFWVVPAALVLAVLI